jgi:hypothetical protein
MISPCPLQYKLHCCWYRLYRYRSSSLTVHGTFFAVTVFSGCRPSSSSISLDSFREFWYSLKLLGLRRPSATNTQHVKGQGYPCCARESKEEASVSFPNGARGKESAGRFLSRASAGKARWDTPSLGAEKEATPPESRACPRVLIPFIRICHSEPRAEDVYGHLKKISENFPCPWEEI